MNSVLPSAPQKISPKVAEQAVEWLIELQDESVSEEIQIAFQRWLDEQPSHQIAWRHIEATNGQIMNLSSPLGSAIAQASLQTTPDKTRRMLTKALIVCLFGGGAGLTGYRQHWLADARTSIGEQKRLILTDGTQLDLNTDSAVTLDFDLPRRNLRLIQGEILISTGTPGVQVDQLTVTTDNGTVTPMGTVFMLRQREDKTEVSVFEGAVKITPHAGRPVTFRAGQRGDFTANTVSSPYTLTSTDRSWQQGILIAESMRLEDFIAQVNRYRTGIIRVDPSIRHLTLSGSYPLADTQMILNALESTLPVKINYRTRFFVTVHPFQH